MTGMHYELDLSDYPSQLYCFQCMVEAARYNFPCKLPIIIWLQLSSPKNVTCWQQILDHLHARNIYTLAHTCTYTPLLISSIQVRAVGKTHSFTPIYSDPHQILLILDDLTLQGSESRMTFRRESEYFYIPSLCTYLV